MSFMAKTVVSLMRAARRSGLIRGMSDPDTELQKAKEFNNKQKSKIASFRKAYCSVIHVNGYPSLVIPHDREKPSDRAILFLHGGGDRDAWKPEVAFARTYGKRTEMDVFYPLYPPLTEASMEETAELIFQSYQRIEEEYGPGRTAVIGGSYGGLLAMQLLTRINRHKITEPDGQAFRMPSVLIMNSPFGFPKTPEEWERAEKLEKNDPMLPEGAFRYMLNAALKADPNTEDHLLYPMDMDFHNAPETYVFYTEEACSFLSDAICRRFELDGEAEKLHMHIEPGMMHCYACAPVFKESRRDFNQQIDRIQETRSGFSGKEQKGTWV